MAWRYIAQRATTKEFLDLDVPFTRDELSWALSGSGALRGSVSPDVGALRAADGRLVLEEWGTLLYAEADGEIRWGGIVTSSSWEGEVWRVEAAGFATYPHGLAYTGNYSKVQIDPAQIVRDLWAHLQAQPDGDLGVVVEGSTSVKVGTSASSASFTTKAGEAVEFEAGPYALDWWDAPDIGQEIDDLAKETPFDFDETHRWDGDDIAHVIRVGYPRLGRRRTDLAFVQGDNVVSVVSPTALGDTYANTVIGIGNGDGKAAVHRTTGIRDGRLRRTAVYTDKGVKTDSRMDALIRGELSRRRQLLDISSVEVTQHPNAPIGSWALGDDVLVEASLPWLGDVSLWCRVVGWSLLTETTARLDLVRSDSFTYGG